LNPPLIFRVANIFGIPIIRHIRKTIAINFRIRRLTDYALNDHFCEFGPIYQIQRPERRIVITLNDIVLDQIIQSPV